MDQTRITRMVADPMGKRQMITLSDPFSSVLFVAICLIRVLRRLSAAGSLSLQIRFISVICGSLFSRPGKWVGLSCG